MKIFVFVLILCGITIVENCSQAIFSIDVRQCDINENLYEEYRDNLIEFAASLYEYLVYTADQSHVFFPLSAWLTLGAIAEGADNSTQQNMFKFLRLPNDPCNRLQFYKLATSRFVSNDVVRIASSRVLVIDEGVTINPIYHNFVLQNSLLDVVSAPLWSDPRATFGEIKRITSASLTNFDLRGNSVILDKVQYSGLWSTAFEDAVIEKSPFYSITGEKIGAVDLMKVKKPARMINYKPLGIEALELPVGHNDRYRIIVGIVRDGSINRSLKLVTGRIFKGLLDNFIESPTPIEVAIPRINLRTEYDVRKVLEDATIKNLWTDPAVTGLISNPGALPSAYVQSSSITFDKTGLRTPGFHQYLSYNESADYYPEFKKEFIANRPFVMGLFDAETYSSIMTIAFTKPTYTD